jgi:putative transposase
MDEYESLSHTKWECKYHGVFIPKRRRKTIYAQLRPHLGGRVPQVGRAEGEQNRGMPSFTGPRAHDDLDPPKYAVSQVVGFIKGKSAIHLARIYGERKRNFVGRHFWARG